MCGIFGYINKFSTDELDSNSVTRIINSIKHRGPDSEGIYRAVDNNIILIHTRLSILDLTQLGNQPLYSKDKRYVIVYNGEVYNYKEIREKLQTIGYVFNSNTDTEVVLISYIEWGAKCVDKFDGMFSFGILDTYKNKIVLIRDKAGVKPLYYSYDKGRLIFSSEIKSFKEIKNFNLELDKDSLKEYLINGFVKSPNTIFKNIKRILPGHFLEYQIDEVNYKITKYWELVNLAENQEIDYSFEKQNLYKLKELLISAIESRMLSDVPVGLFFSGGIDSSLIASILKYELNKSITAFNIGSQSEYFDESKIAKKIADHLEMETNIKIINEEDFERTIEIYAEVYDEPIADNSVVPMILLSEFTSKYVKVALSGDCADELFGGYSYYSMFLQNNGKPKYFDMFKNLYLKNPKIFESIIFNLGLAKTSDPTHTVFNMFFNKNLSEAYYNYKSIWYNFEVERLLCTQSGFERRNENLLSSIDDLLTLDFKTFMTDDILYKVDRASMHYGLEAREPFLNNKLLDFAINTPKKYSINKNETKRLLKLILEDYLPKEFIYREKKGFVIPIHEYLIKNMNLIECNYLNKRFIDEQKLFNYSEISYSLENFKRGKIGYAQKIWSLFMFQKWYSHWYK